MFSFEGLNETGSEMPPSLILLTPMLLVGEKGGRVMGVEEEKEDDEAPVICTGKLVAVWFVWDGKEEEGEEEEKGVVVVVVLVALL
jgi:hypothetical protein